MYVGAATISLPPLINTARALELILYCTDMSQHINLYSSEQPIIPADCLLVAMVSAGFAGCSHSNLRAQMSSDTGSAGSKFMLLWLLQRHHTATLQGLKCKAAELRGFSAMPSSLHRSRRDIFLLRLMQMFRQNLEKFRVSLNAPVLHLNSVLFFLVIL